MVISATMNGGPLMIYFGQEFGEKANEIEGYNDANDRTTMFDFWRVDTHQRWFNQGAFNNDLLNDQEVQLDEFYQQLFKFVKHSSAVQAGQFFDLQYAQIESYPSKFVYSYLRYSNEEILLFVNNFHPTDTLNFKINIPNLAFDLMCNYHLVWQIQKSFIPPTLSTTKFEISENMQVGIPPNSTLVFKAI
jgi:hypothetical protein